VIARARARLSIFPATHYVAGPTMERASRDRGRARGALAELERRGQAARGAAAAQRTQYDIEMMREVGFCNGIENYSRTSTARARRAPHCLLDYFPDDFVCFIDESHQTVPQIGGMYEGDRSRKQTLVDYGFRLPSAMDNRPLTFDEFLERHRRSSCSCRRRPGRTSCGHSRRVVEQIIRPTGLVDPEVEVRPTKNQIDDLMNEIRARASSATSACWSPR
jgi:excinuclease ABC subunit B